MAEQNPQTGTTSAQDTARNQAMQANETQADAGRRGTQGAAGSTGSGAGSTYQGSSGQGTQGAGAMTGSSGSRSMGQPGATWPGSWGAAPFGMLSRMFDEMDRFFDELGFGRRLLPRPRVVGERQMQRAMGALWSPQIEVSERDGQLVICADLPGLRKEDVKVELADDALTIQGERQEQREGRGYSERTYGSFYRTIPLPEGINTEGAQAKFHDGVLEVSIPMPKREQQQKHKQLEIR